MCEAELQSRKITPMNNTQKKVIKTKCSVGDTSGTYSAGEVCDFKGSPAVVVLKAEVVGDPCTGAACAQREEDLEEG